MPEKEIQIIELIHPIQEKFLKDWFKTQIS